MPIDMNQIFEEHARHLEMQRQLEERVRREAIERDIQQYRDQLEQQRNALRNQLGRTAVPPTIYGSLYISDSTAAIPSAMGRAIPYMPEGMPLEVKPIEKKPEKLSVKYKPGQSITEYVEEVIRKTKDEARKKWLMTFQRCVLPDEVRSMIEEALTTVLCANKFKDWGIEETFEKGLTNSILLYGPPGTGKTMIAESFAAVLEKNLLKVSSADIQSQIPGQAERNITKNFEKAKENNAVLMFDECDSLLYNRDAVGMIMASEINHLLTSIENFDGVVILTTNRLGRLDPALQRRIIAKIELPLPNRNARNQIWQNLMPPKMPLSKDIDFKWLSSWKLSGGEIKNIILLAARKAIALNAKEVSMDFFQKATESVVKAKEDFERNTPRAIPHQNMTEGKVLVSG